MIQIIETKIAIQRVIINAICNLDNINIFLSFICDFTYLKNQDVFCLWRDLYEFNSQRLSSIYQVRKLDTSPPQKISY